MGLSPILSNIYTVIIITVQKFNSGHNGSGLNEK